jgi:PAS domain S-box-containing protein
MSQNTARPSAKTSLDRSDAAAPEQALRESEAQFRTLAEALPNHVWTARPDGLLDWFNDRVYQYSGAALGDLDGAGWTRIVHPDDLPEAAARWAAALATGETYEAEFRLLNALGQHRWYIARAVPLRGEGVKYAFEGSAWRAARPGTGRGPPR